MIEGEGEGEVLVSTYVCHPSLANDNLSGIAVATMLAKRLLERRPAPHLPLPVRARARSGRSPGSHQNRERLDRIEHGLTLSCIGDGGNLTYKRSRRGDAEVDRAMEIVLRDSGAPHRVLPWEPWGGDERQFCSPGFDLPVGTLMRTPHGEFDGYHTSADWLERIRPESLAEAVDTCLELVEVLESNRRCINLSPYGEPQLGRRGLYRSAGGAVATPDDERALLWVLNQSDGGSSLLDIARRSGLTYAVVRRAAERLERAELLATELERGRRAGPRHDAALGRARAGHRGERADRQPRAPPAAGGRRRRPEPLPAPGRGRIAMVGLRSRRARIRVRDRDLRAAGRRHPPGRRRTRRSIARGGGAHAGREPRGQRRVARGGDQGGMPANRAQRLAARGAGRGRPDGRSAVALRRISLGRERVRTHVPRPLRRAGGDPSALVRLRARPGADQADPLRDHDASRGWKPPAELG